MFATKILKQAAATKRAHGNNNKNKNNAVQTLIDFLSLQGRLESVQKTQGFCHFLDLSWTNNCSNSNVNVERFSLVKDTASSYRQSSLIYRYRIPNSIRHLDEDENDSKIQLSTYTSILDEVSTWMMTMATFPNPRPGVSVSMGTEWGSFPRSQQQQQQQLSSKQDEEVNIITTLTKKGQTLGFLRCEVQCPQTGDVICYFQHTKYLDLGWKLKLILTPPGRWFVQFGLRYVVPLFLYEDKTIEQTEDAKNQNIMESFRMTSYTTAKFQVGKEHSNGFGGLHGGVQAILMERLGREVARYKLKDVVGSAAERTERIAGLDCTRLNISYQSPAKKQLHLEAFVMDLRPLEKSITLRIVIRRDESDDTDNLQQVIVSEGILSFAVV
jgi:acyl-coenzyme A thioesterase PaaI-like protein